MKKSVGEEGFEPSRPFGHTDLNRARLPFRHPPGELTGAAGFSMNEFHAPALGKESG